MHPTFLEAGAISPTQLVRITDAGRPTPGRRFQEGEPGTLFLIAEGDVRISRHIPGSGEEALAVLKPGACFGEMSVFDRSERSTDAISNGGCRVVTMF